MSNTINQRYELTRILGQGGYGAVFEAQDIVLNRRVALKRLHGGAFGAQIKERFLDEARITSSLRHPSALVMYDFGITEEGDPFLVTELLQGLSLQSYLEQTTLSEAQTVLLLEQVGGALIEAHRQGIIHRDIKPANLYVHTPTGVPEEGGLMVKLLDFGIAKVLSKPAGTGTRSGSIIGTPAYMAPEQIRDSSKVDVRCDQYSLGLVAYECLLGQPAVTGRDEFEVMSNQINAPLPELELSAREVSGEGLGRLVDLIKRMTSKDQGDRFREMSEVLEELGAIKRIHPALADARLDPQPLVDQLKSLESKSYSNVSAPSFEQLSLSGGRSSQGGQTPAPAPRVVDSLSETMGADEALSAPQAGYDSMAETLLPDQTPAQGEPEPRGVSDVGFMDTMLPEEELAQPEPPAQPERQAIATERPPQSGEPHQVGSSSTIRLLSVIAVACALLGAWWGVGREEHAPSGSRAVSATPEAPLRLGPKRRSKAGKYKVVFNRSMPPNGFAVGDEVEVLVETSLGHQVLEYEVTSTPPCLTPLPNAERPLYQVTSVQCGDIEVKVGSLRLIGTIAANQDVDELLELIDP